MTLSRHSSKVYMDEYDLDGLINALRDRMEDEKSDFVWALLAGAKMALSIVRYHEFIDTQADFMRLFETQLPKKEDGNEE